MLQAVILDSHPLSLVCQRRGKPDADACRLWLTDCMRSGVRVSDLIVATSNVRHLARYVPADVWQKIVP